MRPAEIALNDTSLRFGITAMIVAEGRRRSFMSMDARIMAIPLVVLGSSCALRLSPASHFLGHFFPCHF